jgi:hypothetical protein
LLNTFKASEVYIGNLIMLCAFVTELEVPVSAFDMPLCDIGVVPSPTFTICEVAPTGLGDCKAYPRDELRLT